MCVLPVLFFIFTQLVDQCQQDQLPQTPLPTSGRLYFAIAVVAGGIIASNIRQGISHLGNLPFFLGPMYVCMMCVRFFVGV